MQWDADRYEQLQDSAWELELLAGEHRTVHDDRERSRTAARELRHRAASLLAQYWHRAHRPTGGTWVRDRDARPAERSGCRGASLCGPGGHTRNTPMPGDGREEICPDLSRLRSVIAPQPSAAEWALDGVVGVGLLAGAHRRGLG